MLVAMTLRVHLLHEPAADDLARLRAELVDGVEVRCGRDPTSPAHYSILVAGRPERRHLEASLELEALIIPFAGVPKTTRELMREFPHVAIHNLHHNAGPTAELAMALLLAAAKRIVPMDQKLRQHDWRPRYDGSDVMRLEGSRVLVLGYGAVGRRVAAGCSALGMDVVGARRGAAESRHDGVAEIVPADGLRDLLPQARVLVITLPLTGETEGLLGREELALLPEGALLVNVARGAIVDEAALYEALSTGRLGAAGLDVWYAYPGDVSTRSKTAPSRRPLHELDNVVLSPHRGGLTSDVEALRMTHLAHSLNKAARGEEMPHRVNLERGY
jgi:phosphoglycerate dehydrogenase-like enzyme